MDLLAVFMSQVLVLFLMLLGMIIGDIAASSIYGKIKGTFRQVIYLLFFVVFLVLGNYMPAFIGIPNPSIYTAVLLYGLWGFLSVFASRMLIQLLDSMTSFIQGLFYRRNKKKTLVEVDYKALSGFIRERFDRDKTGVVMNALVDSRKGGRASVNPLRVCRILLREKLPRDDVLFILVEVLNLSPEKAVFIYARSS